MVGTTDDPCDDLQSHWKLRHAATPFRVLPSFRPDNIFNIEDRNSFSQYVNKLSVVSGVVIKDMDSLLQALKNRIEFFHDCGCRISDQGLPHMPFSLEWSSGLDAEFKKFLANKDAADFSDPDCRSFKFTVSRIEAACQAVADGDVPTDGSGKIGRAHV